MYYRSKQHRGRINDNNNSNTSITCYTASTTEDRSAALKEALDNAYKEYAITKNIANAITDNELSSSNTHTDEQLTNIIRQRYYPQASDTQVNSVLKHLEDDVTKVATETRYIAPARQVRLYSSRVYYDHVHGLEKQRFSFLHRL
jgi:hypothetical protein